MREVQESPGFLPLQSPFRRVSVKLDRSVKMMGRGIAAIFAVVLLLAVESVACAQSDTPADIQEFGAKMDAPIGVTWAENPLRAALQRLSETQGLAIWLDRRVDPDQKLNFAARDVPLHSVLSQLAAKLSQGSCRLGAVAVIGPADTMAKLPTVNALREQEVQKLPAARKGALTRRRVSQWEDLTTPRELIEQLASEVNIQVSNLDAFPHDLWAGNRLPPLTFCERLSLITAGFDLTYEFSPDGSAVRFVRMPDTAVLKETYELGAPEQAAELARMFPSAEIQTNGDRLLVSASYEDHAMIRRLLRGEAVRRPVDPGPAAGGRKVYTLKFENQPAGAVPTTVAKQLGLRLQYDQQHQEKLQQLISLDVKDVDIDALLKAALDPVGMTFRRDKEVLELLPK